jgi:hypothetical protein
VAKAATAGAATGAATAMAEAATAGAATGVAMAERMSDLSGRSRAAQSLSSAALECNEKYGGPSLRNRRTTRKTCLPVRKSETSQILYVEIR